MSEEQLNKFWSLVKPYLTLWQSVRVTTFAARTQEVWLNLGTRIQLEQEPPDQSDFYLQPRDNFFAFRDRPEAAAAGS